MEEITITSEPRGYPGFPCKIGRTREESEPHWNLPMRPPAGSPNIVIVYMDDMGWADVGCYGSEIATPNIDALAGRGILVENTPVVIIGNEALAGAWRDALRKKSITATVLAKDKTEKGLLAGLKAVLLRVAAPQKPPIPSIHEIAGGVN